MPKTKAQKQKLMDFYKTVIAEENFVIVKVNSVPATALNIFRKKLQDLRAQFHFLKNKIFAKAVSGDKELSNIAYEGQLALLNTKDDIVTAMKLFDELENIAKELKALKGMDEEELKKYKAVEFYMGFVDGKVLNAEETARLKDLPSKEVLLGQLIGLLAAPITAFMNVLNGNTRKFIYALNDLQKSKGE